MKYNIAIVWATWAVWVELIKCIDDLNIPVWNLKLGASFRSAWKKVDLSWYKNLSSLWEVTIEEVDENFFNWVDYALFSAWGDNSKKYAPIANKAWCIVIDNSSAFRYEKDIPLVVPQVNIDAIWDSMIIANPNCTTAIAAVVLYPIYKKYGIEKMIMSTYQATSWAWASGIQELLDNTKKYFSKEEPETNAFVHNIAFNVIPHIDKFGENDYTKEEMKVVWETRKIFWDDSLNISCTCVRIPTLRAHSESIVLETKKDVDIEDIKKILSKSPWVDLVDDIENNIYPMPLNASAKYNVEVWRIRKNLVFKDRWLELFISWDQLLRWAALNAVEILKAIIDKK